MLLVCLTLANFGGPREQVVLSHSLSYHTQHIFVLQRSCKHMFCIDSASVCTCMSKSLCNVLGLCVLHVLGNEQYWAVLLLWSLCYNFLICSEKKGNNTALTNWFITNCKCSDTHGERPSRSVFILGKKEILLYGLAQDYKILRQKLSVFNLSKRGVTTFQPIRKKRKVFWMSELSTEIASSLAFW